jgi:hypothetical protein
VEQGILISGGSSDQPRFQVVSFRDLDSIDFDCDIQQLGESLEHQFRVQRISLKRLDGGRIAYSSELLARGHPVFWPQHPTLKFPDNADTQRIDRRTIRLRGVTKIEGQDSEFVFVFPAPSSIAIRSVVRKQLDAFPRTIRFAHAQSAGLDSAQR